MCSSRRQAFQWVKRNRTSSYLLQQSPYLVLRVVVRGEPSPSRDWFKVATSPSGCSTSQTIPIFTKHSPFAGTRFPPYRHYVRLAIVYEVGRAT